jgi:hypothetical protein
MDSIARVARGSREICSFLAREITQPSPSAPPTPSTARPHSPRTRFALSSPTSARRNKTGHRVHASEAEEEPLEKSLERPLRDPAGVNIDKVQHIGPCGRMRSTRRVLDRGRSTCDSLAGDRVDRTNRRDLRLYAILANPRHRTAKLRINAIPYD